MANNPMNPLNEVFEKEQPTHSRTLRTTFFEKLIDTFFAFSGKWFYEEKEDNSINHVGIFDYLTLGTPSVLETARLWAKENFKHNIFAALSLFPIYILDGSINYLARYITSAVLTLAVSPLVGLINVISQAFAWTDKRVVDNIELADNVTISDHMKNENLTYHQLRYQLSLNLGPNSTVSITKKCCDNPSGCSKCLDGEKYTTPYTQLVTDDEVKSVQALGLSQHKLLEKHPGTMTILSRKFS